MNNDSSTAMPMDPKLARHLFEEGAILIIAAVPVSTEFGIDLCSYTVGEKFRGVKMIPPGPHFVFCASQGKYGDMAPRVGFAHYFKAKEIVVREWDYENEELRERKINDPELEKQRIREHLNELDQFLAPYDYRFINKWKQLTDKISQSDVERCQPALGTLRTNVELQSCPDSERPRGPYKGIAAHNLRCVMEENDLLPKLKPIEGTAPRFTRLPERVPKKCSPADISLHSIDCIEAVNNLVNSLESTDELIGEIQLSFVFFLVGYSLESLVQWRQILHLLANSGTAVEKFKFLYMKYSEILSHQLQHLPEELIIPTEYNTVYKDVRSLLINLNNGCLSYNAERLSKNLEKMKWVFTDLYEEDPEEMPVVVDTNSTTF